MAKSSSQGNFSFSSLATSLPRIIPKNFAISSVNTSFNSSILLATDAELEAGFFNDSLIKPHSNASLLGEPQLKIYHPILAILLSIICVAVVFGNILVMIAIKRERCLQTVTNYFVASLAAADCLVGTAVMPFSVVHEVMGKVRLR